MKNYKSIYQDLKFFDKNGYEIPLVVASNIVIKIYSKYGSEKNATIMNGVYNNEKDINGNYIINSVKIIDVGKPFGFEEIKMSDIIIEVYVDGVMLKNVTINKFEIIKMIPFNIAHTSSNADLNEYVKYGIEDIKFECVLSKEELDELFNTDYQMPYPSLIFSADMDMEKVSTGLHSVETLYLGIEKNGSLIKPYDENYDIVLITDYKDDDVQFFVVDANTDEIYKRHKIKIDLSDENVADDDYFDITSEEFDNVVNVEELLTKTPQVNICFSSDIEGVHTQKIYVMLENRNNSDDIIKIGEFNVTVETEGEDERFRALFANFGIPDPIMYPSLFKECDVKEEKTNWEIVNRKSKELFLTYDEIFPYVGTYKALLNAVKYLGYNDIYFREWYKDIKRGINYSKRLNINENFNDSKPFITYDSILENRMSQKKLNKLSLVYKINEETDETDEYNIPILRNIYNYSVEEVYLKLKSLKEWLERNIIALNCRIIEITGEGVVYERYAYNNYGMLMQNIEHEELLKFTPYVKNKVEKIIDGSANIKVSILNDSANSYISFEDFNETFGEYEVLNNGTLKYPFINDLFVKALVECDSAILKTSKESSLFVNENEILLLQDKNGNLINAKFDKAPIIHLQNANIRLFTDVNDKTYKEWWSDIAFNVYNRADDVYSYYIRNIKEEKYKISNDYIILMPINNESTFEYSYKEDIDSPVFIFKGYKLCLYNNNTCSFDSTFFDINQKYILEINKGKIINESYDATSFITFDYKKESNEQVIKVNYQYEGGKSIEKIYNNDSSIAIYEPYYNINVKKSGDYRVVAYAINDYGNVFAKEVQGGCKVMLDEPFVASYTDCSYIENDKNFYINDSSSTSEKHIITEKLPSLRWKSHIYEMEIDSKKNEISYPNLSYSYDTAKKGNYINFMNINDRFIYYSKNSKNNYTFYSINKVKNLISKGDDIQFIIYAKKCLNGIFEYNAKVIDITKNGYYTIEFAEDIELRDYLNNNYEFYIFPTTEYKIGLVEFEDGNNYTDVYIEELVTEYAYTLNEEEKLQKAYYENEENIVEPLILKHDAKEILKIQRFNVGDVVKLIYQVGGDEIDKNYLYYSNNGLDYYKVLYNIDNDYFPVSLGNNGEVEIVNNIEKTNIFCGGASFRIIDIDKETGRIRLDGKFNYKQYKDEYLYYKKDDGELYPLRFSLNDNNVYVLKNGVYEKVYYLDNNDNLTPVTLPNDDLNYSFVKLTNYGEMIKITTNLFISKANQQYVNYVLRAEETEESPYNDTIMRTRRDRLYDFIDDTYSFVVTEFDKVNAFENWNKVEKNLFRHIIPITINKEEDVVFRAYSEKYKIKFIRWRVYKQNINNKTRELFIEVQNDLLSLNMKESGIYDIEVYAFDEYGNIAHKDYQALLNVK